MHTRHSASVFIQINNCAFACIAIIRHPHTHAKWENLHTIGTYNLIFIYCTNKNIYIYRCVKWLHNVKRIFSIISGDRVVMASYGRELHVRNARAEDNRAVFSCLVLDKLTGDRKRSDTSHLVVSGQ